MTSSARSRIDGGMAMPSRNVPQTFRRKGFSGMLIPRGRPPQGEHMPADSTSPSVPDLQRRVDQLVAELCARTSDHEEALRREAAIAEILQVTNASGGDLALVLNAIIEKATRLCSASYGYIWTYDGESARAVAVHGDARFEEWLLQRDPVRPSQHSPLGRVLLSRRLAHVVDAKEDETYRNDPRFRDLVDRAGLRTLSTFPCARATPCWVSSLSTAENASPSRTSKSGCWRVSPTRP